WGRAAPSGLQGGVGRACWRPRPGQRRDGRAPGPRTPAPPMGPSPPGRRPPRARRVRNPVPRAVSGPAAGPVSSLVPKPVPGWVSGGGAAALRCRSDGPRAIPRRVNAVSDAPHSDAPLTPLSTITTESEPAADDDPVESVRERLALLPDQPGVYMFKNAAGDVIYVGKAIS